MHLFLTDTTQGPYATLPPDESKHCIRVLRMQPGDELYVTSGDGTMCRARIFDPDPTACQVEITERLPDYGARPFKLHMAVAPTKNNARMEWFVEKSVEIGIDRITPIICDHSERGALKTDRLERIALSAMKQSLQATLPIIDPPVNLPVFLQNLNSQFSTLNSQKNLNSQFSILNSQKNLNSQFSTLNSQKNLNSQFSTLNSQKFVCHCVGDDRRTLHQLYTPGTDALVLIGPEGDFSPHEIAEVLAQGFQPVTLGNNRLRTETAALYALTALNFMNGDLRIES